MIIKWTLGDAPLQLSTNFVSTEFECRCGCKEQMIDDALVTGLENMRTNLGTKLNVTSGYRCANYQEQLRLRGFDTAKGISQHQLGCAADVTNGVAPGHELEDAASTAGFQSIGVGKHWVHVDLRPGPRRWAYAY